MRILQVCNKPPYPPRDGGSIAMLNLARSLCRLGHEVTVLTMCTPKHNISNEFKLEFRKMMHLHTVFVNTAVRFPAVLKNFLFSRNPYNAERFISADFDIALARLLQSEKYDVVQLEGLYLAPYITTVRKYSNALVTLRAHNVEHEIWKRLASTERNFVRKLYFRTLAKRILRFESEVMNRYDLLVPITGRDLENFNRLGNQRPAHVCPVGIDIESAGPPFKSTRTLHLSLFFLGSLDWIPNQEGLLWFISHVFPELLRRNPEIRLHIAGRNAPVGLIECLHQPGLIFHGEITDAKEFMQAYGIMVAPCFSGSGMRVKIIEAMAKGKPVITTPLGAEGLTVRSGENIIIAIQAEEFIEQLEKLLNYPEFYLNIGQNARDFVVETYNNTTLAENLADFYKLHLT